MGAGDVTAVPAVRLTGVSKAFGGKNVLSGLDLEVPVGTSLVVLGKSGVGKSVLLKHVIGLLKPDSGRVEVGGVDIWSVSARERDQIRRRFGMSFQEGALFDSMTVGENISFPLRRHTRMSAAEVRDRVAECLELVRLPGIEAKGPSELSGGMRRRVAIARAIITQPELLLYDSPTGGLDPVTSTTIVELIVKQHDEYHTSALMVTHRLQDAFTMASHYYDSGAKEMRPLLGAHGEPKVNLDTTFVILKDGKVIFDGNAPELARSSDEYIREYIA